MHSKIAQLDFKSVIINYIHEIYFLFVILKFRKKLIYLGLKLLVTWMTLLK